MADISGGVGRLLAALKRTSSFGGGGSDVEGGDIYQTVLGKDSSQLKNEGAVEYPDVPGGSQHHALAGRLATEKLMGMLGDNPLVPRHMAEATAFIVPQIAGLGVEGLEGLVRAYQGTNPFKDFGDTVSDVKANARGSYDALKRGLEKGKSKR